MATDIDMRGTFLGTHLTRLNHPYQLRITFAASVAGYTFLAHVRRGDLTSVTPLGVASITVESSTSILISLTRPQVKALGVGPVTMALDEVSPGDRELLYWTLDISQDATF